MHLRDINNAGPPIAIALTHIPNPQEGSVRITDILALSLECEEVLSIFMCGLLYFIQRILHNFKQNLGWG